jgi:hypothetical protein
MNNFGASGRIIQNVSVCHLKNVDPLSEITKKNPPAFSYRWKIKLLLRKRRISTAAKQLLFAIMYFFATSRTED